jgi:cobyrinic acid a,c-diamide synthase
MVNLIPMQVAMRDRLQALGYVEVETMKASILGPAGLRFRGHQFRYSDLEEVASDVECAYVLSRKRTGTTQAEGYQKGNILASYVHAHWASNPLIASGFIESCATYAANRS